MADSSDLTEQTMKRVAFRVDATMPMGTGHFMRCLTLAEGLKRRGARILFISRDLPEYLRELLKEKDMALTLLPTLDSTVRSAAGDLAHANWLSATQEQDAQASIEALTGQSWDWLVVDHYALDVHWESALRATAKRIMVIDDLADRQHDCDVLLDQNFYADMGMRYDGKVPPPCQLLLGPRYALLREVFRELRKQVQPRTGAVKRILVFFGGVDAGNYTGQAIEALKQIGISDLHVDVVIGAQHPSREQIRTECTRHGFNCHVQTDKMAELMAAADLAIGAGGVATWERCSLGVPSLVFSTADNQKQQVKDAARRGLLFLPENTSDLTQVIRRHVLALAENDNLRRLISDNGMQTVDGHGVSRVLASMGYHDVVVQMATLEDSEKLFNWRNHPSIREVSRNTDMIAWKDHQQWLASVLADAKKWLLIGKEAGTPIGVVRFDAQNDEAEVSIYLIPEKTSSGLGQNLLQSAEHWLTTNHPEICKIRAHVLGTNEHSLRFFSKAGYQIESADYSKRLH